jgi:hypothetical protein
MPVTLTTDLRSRVGIARDQGQRPTCLAFAASDAHAGSRGLSLELSAEHAFFLAHQRAGTNPQEGAGLPEMLQGIHADGQILEADWPYLPALPANLGLWQPSNAATGHYFQANASIYPSWSSAIQQIDKTFPILITMRLSDSFYAPSTDGIVDQIGSEKGDPKRRHAVVGLATGVYRGHDVLLVRNSWGSSWGLSGYAWLTEPFLSPRLDTLTVFIGDPHVSSNP